MLALVCAACGARTGTTFADDASDVVADASIDGAAAPKDAGHDVPRDSPPDVFDAAPDVACTACVRMLVNDDNGFYELDAPEGTIKKLGPAPDLFLADIALTPDKRTLYGAGSGLAVIDMTTWKTSGSVPGGREMNALEVGQDGTIYGAEWDTVYATTPRGGLRTLTTFPDGMHSSGDLAFAGGHLFATVFSTSYDALVEIDLSTNQARVVGPTQARCIFGLVSGDPHPLLYGLTCIGELVQIDVATAQTKVLATLTGHDFLGATRL
jgi:hypothetical protein